MVDVIRDILKDNTELFHRYEKSEARYILQLPDDYATMPLFIDLDKKELDTFIAVLAELHTSLDEWVSFKLKELIISDRLSGKDTNADAE